MACNTRPLTRVLTLAVENAKRDGLCVNCIATELIAAALSGVLGLEGGDRAFFARHAIEGFRKAATMPEATETRQ